MKRNTTPTKAATSAPALPTWDELMAETKAELARWRADGMTENEIAARVIQDLKDVQVRAMAVLAIGADAVEHAQNTIDRFKATPAR